jgi:hypothetical protein
MRLPEPSPIDDPQQEELAALRAQAGYSSTINQGIPASA